MRLPLGPALGLLVMIAAGCSDSPSLTSDQRGSAALPQDVLVLETEGRQGGTLDYALASEPATFNFLAARDSRSKLVTYLTTATLLEFDPVKQDIQGGITRDWSVSADGTEITLHLRRGVNFSDGRPLSAEDVAFTFEKIYEEGSSNALRDTLLMGGKPLHLTVVDSHTVKIRFPERYAAAEYLLTTVPILPRHHFTEAGKKIEEHWTLGTSPQQMAGLGPFVLQAHYPGQSTVYAHNPHYWKVDQGGTRLPYLDQLVIHYVEDRNNQLLRFQNGQVDLLDRYLRPEDNLQLQETGGEHIEVHNAGPSDELYFFWFNLNTGKHPQTGKPYLSPQEKDWFGNLKFRQAVSTAISRDTIVRNIFLGQARPAWGLVPNSIPRWHAPDARQYHYNQDQARSWLRQAGFSWRQNGAREVLVDSKGRPVRFELLTRSDDVFAKIASIVQQDLEEMGMQVTLRQEEFRSALSRIMGSYDYDASILKIGFPIDPSDHMNVLSSSAEMHMWHPNQPQPATEWERRIDSLMRQQMTSLDQEQRRRIYREVQHIMAEQLPIIPLVNADVFIAHKSRLKSLHPTHLFPQGLANVWELWLEELP
ncbi:MAG: ABC transporter substrate-binding protein [Acidobacteriota bacterium]